jgi:adenylosuccinate lyase
MIERYSRRELRELWSDASRYELWLQVELAVCDAMEADGTVPKGTAQSVRELASGKLSARRILEIEKTTRHDVIAFLTHVEELAGEPSRWLHLGMTSSDVLDTTIALQCRRALDRILAGVDELRAACAERAREHASTPMIGRSHGIHAEPITAGLVFARWYAELGRARGRVERAREAINVGKIAGAVGTYANSSPKVEKTALFALGLLPETVATQVVARDRHAEVMAALALLGTAVEQIAIGVRHWQRTEVAEAEEGFGRGQKGSSAMPHKKNPILSENLTGLSRLLRALRWRTPRSWPTSCWRGRPSWCIASWFTRGACARISRERADCSFRKLCSWRWFRKACRGSAPTSSCSDAPWRRTRARGASASFSVATTACATTCQKLSWTRHSIFSIT